MKFLNEAKVQNLHKQFTYSKIENNKRRFEQITDDNEIICRSEQQVIKRRKIETTTTEFFRPWEQDNINSSNGPKTNCHCNKLAYHPSMVRNFPKIQRNEKEQRLRDRNTILCLLYRQSQRREQFILQQEYSMYTQQQLAMWQEIIRSGFYIRALQQQK